MEIILQPSAERAVGLTAQLIAKSVRENPRLALGLATGRTMEAVYARLARMHREDALDFRKVRTFNLDEYVGLPADDPHSYRHYMTRHFFEPVGIPAHHTFLPDGMAQDLDAECRAYEEKIKALGGIDLQLLGIGNDGHIGFNEPLSALMSRTRPKALSPETLAQNGPLFGDPTRMPRRALTMGVGTILESRRALMLVTGAAKADILAQAVEGPITSMISATALQLHPHCVVIADEAAAAELRGTAYYRRVFETEPEWAEFR